MTLADGVERGVRLLEFRTGAGLRFTVLVDRAFDIAECEFKGQAIGWQSPTGFRHPGLIDYEGEAGLGWLRARSPGCLSPAGSITCCGPAEGAGRQLRLSRSQVRAHIRCTAAWRLIPAQLDGLWRDAGAATNACCGRKASCASRRCSPRTCISSTHRGRRRRRARSASSIASSITASAETPHMFFYHVNVGYPVARRRLALSRADRGRRVRRACRALRRQGVGYRVLPAPSDEISSSRFGSTNWRRIRPAGPRVALVNDRMGLGFEVRTRKDQLPCLYQWQDFQAGHLCAGDRAFDASCARRAVRARARRDDLAQSTTRSRSYDARIPRARRRARRSRRRKRASRRSRANRRRISAASGRFRALAANRAGGGGK